MPQNLRFPYDKSLMGSLCKTLLISVLFLYLISIFLFNSPNCPASQFFYPWRQTWPSSKQKPTGSTTDLGHLMFGLVGSVNAWRHRKAYIESWWRPNVTRGYLFLDTYPTEDLLPWPSSSPPFRVSDNLTKLLKESKHVAPVMVRMVHAILEVLREDRQGVRWLIMGDDDSIFFVDNWVDVLATYDHTGYIYIGGHSEAILSNAVFSFETGFGGAGFALSYPLAESLVKYLEDCFKRYPYLRSADYMTMTCVVDLGVSLTTNRGIHQIDLTRDISGFLSSHPQAPILSLHHFDVVDPIFPSMNRSESTMQLMKAANIDQSRLLQQTVCYHKPSNWSFSISWGYSTHIYEKLLPRTFLKKALETFRPWARKTKPPHYMFDTRRLSNDPCEAPHVFFFKSIEQSPKDHEFVTSYVRASLRGLQPCSSSGNHSADYISKIQVFSSATKLIETGKSECCDIVRVNDEETAKVKIRACVKDEIIG